MKRREFISAACLFPLTGAWLVSPVSEQYQLVGFGEGSGVALVPADADPDKAAKIAETAAYFHECGSRLDLALFEAAMLPNSDECRRYRVSFRGKAPIINWA